MRIDVSHHTPQWPLQDTVNTVLKQRRNTHHGIHLANSLAKRDWTATRLGKSRQALWMIPDEGGLDLPIAGSSDEFGFSDSGRIMLRGFLVSFGGIHRLRNLVISAGHDTWWSWLISMPSSHRLPPTVWLL